MEKQQSEIFIIIKENRKRFLGNIWRNYSNQALLLYHTEDAGLEQDLMLKYLWLSFPEKNYARELAVLYHAGDDLIRNLKPYVKGRNWYKYCTDRESILKVLEKLHKRYWDRFHKVYGKRAKERGGWPKMMKTLALKEHLLMGYMHMDDLPFRINKTKYYYVYCHIGDLWYPMEFKSHQDAIEYQVRYGIPGYTGTTLLKTK